MNARTCPLCGRPYTNPDDHAKHPGCLDIGDVISGEMYPDGKARRVVDLCPKIRTEVI